MSSGGGGSGRPHRKKQRVATDHRRSRVVATAVLEIELRDILSEQADRNNRNSTGGWKRLTALLRDYPCVITDPKTSGGGGRNGSGSSHGGGGGNHELIKKAHGMILLRLGYALSAPGRIKAAAASSSSASAKAENRLELAQVLCDSLQGIYRLSLKRRVFRKEECTESFGYLVKIVSSLDSTGGSATDEGGTSSRHQHTDDGDNMTLAISLLSTLGMLIPYISLPHNHQQHKQYKAFVLHLVQQSQYEAMQPHVLRLLKALAQHYQKKRKHNRREQHQKSRGFSGYQQQQGAPATTNYALIALEAIACTRITFDLNGANNSNTAGRDAENETKLRRKLFHWQCLAVCPTNVRLLMEKEGAIEQLLDVALAYCDEDDQSLAVAATDCLSQLARQIPGIVPPSSSDDVPVLKALLVILLESGGGVKFRAIPGLRHRVDSRDRKATALLNWNDVEEIKYLISTLVEAIVSEDERGVRRDGTDDVAEDAAVVLLNVMEILLGANGGAPRPPAGGRGGCGGGGGAPRRIDSPRPASSSSSSSSSSPAAAAVAVAARAIPRRDLISICIVMLQSQNDGVVRRTMDMLCDWIQKDSRRMVRDFPELLSALAAILGSPFSRPLIQRTVLELFHELTRSAESSSLTLARQTKVLDSIVTVAASRKNPGNRRLALSLLVVLSKNVSNRRILARQGGVLACLIRYVRESEQTEDENDEGNHQFILEREHLKQNIMQLATAL